MPVYVLNQKLQLLLSNVMKCITKTVNVKVTEVHLLSYQPNFELFMMNGLGAIALTVMDSIVTCTDA